jgi:hypothetical protein
VLSVLDIAAKLNREQQYCVRYSGTAANTAVWRDVSGDCSVFIFSGQQFKNF